MSTAPIFFFLMALVQKCTARGAALRIRFFLGAPPTSKCEERRRKREEEGRKEGRKERKKKRKRKKEKRKNI